ncbi:MAG TPA: glycosyltransferase family A protein [Polyangiaceae bacterium]|nr:glycosyltransferase family A protein [Polyangiaceae bacterium]
MSIRVSVVIPMYRASAWIEATLDSVVRQTYPAENIEIIAIDDASPDDSAAVATEFLARHPHESRVVRQTQNGGLPATRNAGYRLATGSWIQFLDQDDLLAPHKLALQVAAVESAPPDVAVVYSNWQYFVLKDGQWQGSGELHAPQVDDDPVLRIVEEFDFATVGPCLIRASFLERIGGFELAPNLGEDTDLMLRLARAGGRFREAHSKEVAFLYRQLPGSLAGAYGKNKVAMRNLLETFRAVESFWRKTNAGSELSERQRLALAKRYSRFAHVYLEHDPEAYSLIETWLAGLGFERPIVSTPKPE